MSTNLKTLIGKLNDTCREAATRAAGLCVGLGQFEVDLEHLFLALLEQPASDFVAIAVKSGIGPAMLEADLQAELARLKTGNTRTPVFSPRLPRLFEHAWLLASLDLRAGRQARIRSAHLLQALLTEPELAQLALRASRLFEKFRLDDIKHDLASLTAGSREAAADMEPQEVELPGDDLPAVPKVPQTPALDRFTISLQASAREGKLDPVIGRDMEIRQTIDILMRRRQNNPILTGEAGVGKTAVVEGLALRIASGDVPDKLKAVAIHTLDLGLLQAGASVKGEFESRLKSVIDEVRKSAHPIVLFIDEAHTMIGAGGAPGQGDAANLLKPALARGELRTIAATTWGEYKKYFEKDAALARRFQAVKVEEPDEELACAMLRAMAPLMEQHFGVRVCDLAVTEAVRLSHRYITGRQLPDKAISVLDTACAKVALGQNATPALIETLRRKLERIDAEAGALTREESSGSSHSARLAQLHALRRAVAEEEQTLSARLVAEKSLSEKIISAQRMLESGAYPAGHDGMRGRAGELQLMLAELKALQGETPMVPVQVDGQVVAEIVAAWTGIPLGRMVRDEIAAVLRLKGMLEERVLGQPHAMDAVAQRVRTARASLDEPCKPQGVFLFAGPSGVGKTETALALADLLYGGERKLITINMSEYQEAHSVSGLKGSPPGYVGYGEGGVLTEAVRRNPYSVVLLDEAEKAHADVMQLFFQVFDKGVLDDAEGRAVDFRNTIIILTSNTGSATLMQACLNRKANELPSPAELEQAIRPQLMKVFKPAFLGRLRVIPFYPLGDEILANIIGMKLRKIQQRLSCHHKTELAFDDTLVEAVLARCTETDSGARNVDHILNGSLLPELATAVLVRMAEGAGPARIKVSANKLGQFKYTIK